MNKTQSILNYLKAGNTITDMKAAQFFSSYRLSAIIYELRHRYDLDIRDRWIENKILEVGIKSIICTKKCTRMRFKTF